jgi:predicted nucleic acid-binding protein
MKPNITLEESNSIKALLAECHIMEMNQAIQNNQDYRLKLADSIILASAQTFGIPFITADIEFRKVDSPDQDILLFRP